MVQQVTIPFVRLVAMATRLGSQEHTVCPSDDHICWRHRELQPFAEGEMPTIECRECWLRFMVNGD